MRTVEELSKYITIRYIIVLLWLLLASFSLTNIISSNSYLSCFSFLFDLSYLFYNIIYLVMEIREKKRN